MATGAGLEASSWLSGALITISFSPARARRSTGCPRDDLAALGGDEHHEAIGIATSVV
jgi:hypothetical protein